MVSPALLEWRTDGLSRLDELERIHISSTGSGRGRRWGTTQLNRSLFVALSAQFQNYCRRLHDESIIVHVAAASPAQRELLRSLLTQGRKLDRENARKGSLGSDFGRLGINLIDCLVHSDGGRTRVRLDMLERLVDYRNAVGHGNESKLADMEAAGQIAATKACYRRYRAAISALARTMDVVVDDELAIALGIERPWRGGRP